MASTSTLPVLLPSKALPPQDESPFEWKPKRDLANPPPPPPEDMTPEQEAAAARLSLDGKFRKVRPRRTVDYGGPMGRWTVVSRIARSFLLMLAYSGNTVAETAALTEIHPVPSACASIHYRCRMGTFGACID